MKEPRYGYAPLPSEQQLDERTRMKQMSIIAAARQKSLGQDREQAQEMAQTPVDGGSWAGLIGTGLQGAVGRTRDARAQEQEQANQVQLNQALGAQAMAEQEDAMRKEQHLLTQAQLAQQNKEAEMKAAADRHREVMQFRRSKLASDAVNRKQPVLDESAPRFLKDGTPVNASWDGRNQQYVADDGTIIPKDQMKQHGSISTSPKERQSLSMAPSILDRTNTYRNEMQDEDWQTLAQPNGLPTEVVNKFLSATSNTGIAEWIENEKSGLSKYTSKVDWDLVDKQRQFLNDFKLSFVMPYREQGTSGVLSNQDVNEFNSAIDVQMGQNWKNMKSGVLRLADMADQKLNATYKNMTTRGDADSYGIYQDTLGKYYGEGGLLNRGEEEEAEAPPVAEAAPPSPEEVGMADRVLQNRGQYSKATIAEAEAVKKRAGPSEEEFPDGY